MQKTASIAGMFGCIISPIYKNKTKSQNPKRKNETEYNNIVKSLGDIIPLQTEQNKTEF